MSALVQRQRRATRSLSREPTEAKRRFRRWLAAGLVTIAFGLAAVALLGPLVTGLIDYRVTGPGADR